MSGSADELRRIIDARDVSTVFQPIVDLTTQHIVAYEALTRGPTGSALQMPDVLFAVAAEHGMTTELDLACLEASLKASDLQGLTSPFSLFVNIEAATIAQLAGTPPRRPVVVEVTERDLLSDPGELIRSVARLRDAGMLVAMDDVGTNSASLALLPLLQPDIIKLDMSLLQKAPGRNAATVMDAVTTYTEHFTTTVLAEGVETERDLVRAQALGATLGQGWFFGRPAPEVRVVPTGQPFGAPAARNTASTPFEVATVDRVSTPSAKPLLIEASKFLEACALDCDETTIVFSTFQNNANFNDRMQQRYAQLAERASLVVAFVQNGTAELPELVGLPNLRVVTFDEDDALAAEWSVIVLNPRYCAMLTARETFRGDSAAGGAGGAGAAGAAGAPGAAGRVGEGSGGRSAAHGEAGDGDQFEFLLTHDRRLVTLGALTLAVHL